MPARRDGETPSTDFVIARSWLLQTQVAACAPSEAGARLYRLLLHSGLQCLIRALKQPTSEVSPKSMLTAEQLSSFHENGFVHGFAVRTPDEMAEIRKEIESILREDGFSGAPTAHRHLDCPLVHQLCAHREVVDRVASILGPDLLLWYSRFFDKQPGSEPVHWHQDGHFWPIEPDTCVSAWIAIDRADETNGCLEAIPGSHRALIRHVPGGAGRF